MSNEPALYSNPLGADETLDLSFLESGNLEEIEEGIRRMNDISDLISLTKGIAITKMEREELYKQAGFSSLREYRQVQFKRLNAPKGTISTWRRVGEGYLDNIQFIEAYRIPIKRNVIKLSMLTDALMRFDRAEVARRFVSESYREFARWLNPTMPRMELADVDLVVDGGLVLLDGLALISISEDVPSQERHFISDLLEAGYRARRGSCQAHVVPVRSDAEAKAIDEFLVFYRTKQ